ncbi:ABC transporter ATP-binding protein [Cytobacillus spongiae]|jgi:ABC-2 type transport system ATP-binding protein|uniref:ABC transporter ATP-binding protein n=1 Tax=Cytobacillus spongiae TaxID=2901381 RepID=UPI001F219EDF|nr:ABC transporter ATP-binding protein [Cytobacillus spongiae]UII57747.1 ABC transporter ATP-binding protein [Cytobacillus spongiae]
MIRLHNIQKRFENFQAIEQVDLSIEKGSIYGLLGSNGAGKTTLLKLLAGIFKQDQGDVLIDEQSVYENPAVKEKIFFIPDYPYFLPQYSIIQMGKFYQGIYTNWNEERFRKLVEAFAIEGNKKLHKFSKGVQRQAAFILALSTMPEILILDEPMDGLDPVVRKNMKSLLIEDVADREMTVLISSHNLREVEDICNVVGILHNGRMILEEELDYLKSDIHKIQLAFKGDIPNAVFSGLQVVHQERRGSILLCIVKGNEADVIRQIEQFHPVILDVLPLTLEEIFIYEMGDAGYAIHSILV